MRGALKELQSLLRILRFNSKCRSSDAKDSGMMFRRMLPAFSPTICGIFRECLILYLPRYEREVIVRMPEPHTIDSVTAHAP
jgi:hypothetical protein